MQIATHETDTEMTDPKSMLFQLAGASIVIGIVARNKYLGFGGLILLACTSIPDVIRYAKISRM